MCSLFFRSGEMSKVGGLGTYLFFGIFIIAGIGLTFYGITVFQTSSDSMHWPTTDGSIINSTYSMTHESRERNNHHVLVTFYWPSVSYHYLVNNISYTSTKITLISSGSENYDSVATILNRYPVGQMVTVHYNPTNPAQAVLEPGTQGAAWAFIGGGLLFAVCGGGALAYVLLNMRRRAGNPPKQGNDVTGDQV